MNLVIISGRLVKDPEIRNTKTDRAMCLVTIAVDDGKDKEGNKRTQFVPCVAWDRNGEAISKWFNKGDPIIVYGHLSCRTWEKDGTKRYAWEAFIDRWEFVPGVNTKPKAEPGEFREVMDMDDAELPF